MRANSENKRAVPVAGLGLVDLLDAASRGISLFVGAFSLLNILGGLRLPGFDANYWWIDLRPIPSAPAQVLLTLAAILLVAHALRPRMSNWRWNSTLVITAFLLLISLSNAAGFYVLVGRGAIRAGCPVAFSLVVGIALLIVLAGIVTVKASACTDRRLSAKFVLMTTVAVCLVGFPLGQIFCFGKTDYRRPADAIVVFGARVYPDGRCSDALADRVRTGCRLYLDGLAKWLILSGGPGDGDVHETQAMREMALEAGVPAEAILTDENGVNTQGTVTDTCNMFEDMGISRVLAVSHFYHLPRIKMSYQRRGRQVYTVPARESYTLTKMPLYILREVAALWAYYCSSYQQ